MRTQECRNKPLLLLLPNISLLHTVKLQTHTRLSPIRRQNVQEMLPSENSYHGPRSIIEISHQYTLVPMRSGFSVRDIFLHKETSFHQ